MRYGAEYFGEEFHGDDDQEVDENRLEWLGTERGWAMDVFTKVDVYGPDLRAGDRLHRGFVRARATYATRSVTVIDLAR